MRPQAIEIAYILLEDTSQVSLAHDQDMVEAVSANTAHQSLADRIRTRCSDWRSEHLNACSDGNSVEVCAILGVIVADEIRRCFTKGRRLAQLLGHPCVRWRASHTHMNDPS